MGEDLLGFPGVTGQNTPPAGIYLGWKWPRLDYTRYIIA